MDPPSSSSSNTRNNVNINNINSNQDNPLSSFLIPSSYTPPPPPTTSYIPNYNITTNPTAMSNTSPSSSSQPPPRGTSKKRTRASRRAPTTVLSTDTSNFRAMVQEFTGFPSPPFPASNSSPSIHSFNQLFSRSSFPPHLHNITTASTFSPSSILHAIASNTASTTSTYPPNMLMFNNNATPSSINNLTSIHGGGVQVHGHGHNVASTQFGDLGRVLVGSSNNGNQDRCDDDDDDHSSTREDKRRKSVLDSWNDHI